MTTLLLAVIPIVLTALFAGQVARYPYRPAPQGHSRELSTPTTGAPTPSTRWTHQRDSTSSLRS
jgi:hypothetical protein